MWNVWKLKTTLVTTLQRGVKTDIRHIRQRLPTYATNYDPRELFGHGKVFLGMGESQTPEYMDYETFSRTHGTVSGATGAGKGKLCMNLGVQAVYHDECLIFLDPKGDFWAPHVLGTMARAMGKQYVYVDLRPGAPPQLNALGFGTPEDIAERVCSGFGLRDRGDAAD